MPGAVRALLLSALVTLALWPGQKIQPLSAFDQPFYLGIASDIRHEHVFTDGYFFAGTAQPRPAGMRFAPLYPGLLAAMAQIDPWLRANMDCLVRSGGADAACGRAAPLMRALQWAELVGVLWLIWSMGFQALGANGAVLALGLALLTVPLLLRSVDYMMTEMTCLLLTTAASASAQRMLRPGRKMIWAALTGMLLALAALTRPAFLYLIPLACLAWGAAILRRRRFWRPALAFTAASAATLAPWVLRNAIVLGRPALTFGYAGHTLAQRIAFNRMDWAEYGQAFICWLPDGNALGRAVFGRGVCDRFGWDTPDSFYLIGQREMVSETLRAAGGPARHMHYLLQHEVLAHPAWHLAVSLPLALRGAYVAHWWGLILLPACLWFTASALRRRDWALLAVLLPAWFMLALNAAVAVNQVRYNLMLIPPYCLAGAAALLALWRKVSGENRQA